MLHRNVWKGAPEFGDAVTGGGGRLESIHGRSMRGLIKRKIRS